MLELFWPTEEVHVHLQRPSSEVLRDLATLVAAPGFIGSFKERLAGRVEYDRLHLQRKAAFNENSLAPEFRGAIAGDRIVGRFQPTRGGTAFVVLWLATIVFYFVPTQVRQVRSQGWTSDNITITLTMALMLIVGLIMPRLGWRAGRKDREYIKAALSRAAGATMEFSRKEARAL